MPNYAYKVLGPNGEAVNGGNGSWFLPSGKRPGKWMPKIDEIEPCRSGYHLCERGNLVEWLGPTIWKAEWRGDVMRQDDKIIVQQARLIQKCTAWNMRAQRLFACDCAERVLHLYEDRYPDDSRVRNCIETARKVASGELPVRELSAAVKAAGAVEGAVQAAAWSARAAIWSARDAARAAAWAAVWSAVWSARDAAWAAERQWQAERLFHYLEGDQGGTKI